jgi:hypothetical protein
MAYVHRAQQTATETRVPCRRSTLVATADRQSVARRPRLSQLSPQSLHPSELPCLSFRGKTSQLCPLWPPARTSLFPVCTRGISSPSSALVGQRACSAGTPVPGRVAKSPSFETGARPGFEKRGGLKGAQGLGRGKFDRAAGDSGFTGGARPRYYFQFQPASP